MKTLVSSYDFHRAFEELRSNNFSYNGLDALFEYFEEYEDSTDTEIELDVIAICCDFSESTVDEIINNYIHQKSCGNECIYDADVWEEIKAADNDDDEIADIIERFLSDNTTVMRIESSNGIPAFVYAAF